MGGVAGGQLLEPRVTGALEMDRVALAVGPGKAGFALTSGEQGGLPEDVT